MFYLIAEYSLFSTYIALAMVHMSTVIHLIAKEFVKFMVKLIMQHLIVKATNSMVCKDMVLKYLISVR